jgi:hypothetical protein
MGEKKKFKPMPIEFKDKHQKYYYLHRKKCLRKQQEYVENNFKTRQKTIRIHNWKRKGIIDTDYELLHDCYDQQTHCWICGRKYKHTKERCLDHDHNTGECRYICCINCNTKLLCDKYQ